MPITFFNKKLDPWQTKWSTVEREAFCVYKFDTWIFVAEVQIISDHNPFSYLAKSAPHRAKLFRWVLALQRYNMSLTYRKVICHGNADALSRHSELNLIKCMYYNILFYPMHTPIFVVNLYSLFNCKYNCVFLCICGSCISSQSFHPLCLKEQNTWSDFNFSASSTLLWRMCIFGGELYG